MHVGKEGNALGLNSYIGMAPLDRQFFQKQTAIIRPTGLFDYIRSQLRLLLIVSL